MQEKSVPVDKRQRTLSIGAELVEGGAHFRVWAPKCQKVEVVLETGEAYFLEGEGNGYFSQVIQGIGPNTLYRFRLDGEGLFPDPASRFQPSGPHGPSQILDPSSFQWSDAAWKGIESRKVILYELHVGTFTEEGTWQSALKKLPYLQDLGITVIEMMPIAECPGRFNWGYDGVDFFAPYHHYGHPNDLKAFINEAHHLGIGVILDVVYNHFGPDGNYLLQFSDSYLKKEPNEWGASINFEHPGVRDFFIENAGYWIGEFHFDGLRLDACHAINDQTDPHILLEIAKKARAQAGSRKIYLSAENEKEQAHFVLSEREGGYSLDAVWDEDFHHSAFVRLTGRKEGYFSDYSGRAQEFVSSIKHNFLYQGQWYSWQKKRRGSPAIGLPAHHFIHFLENHDQIANTGNALRLYQTTHLGIYRALTALLFLSPQTPLLFQGQEFGSSSPFYYFCDHPPELAPSIYEGRMGFFSQFKSLDNAACKQRIPFPGDEQTFLKSKLKWQEKEKNREIYQLHKDLIEIRKKDEVFGNPEKLRVEGAVFNQDAFVLRYFSEQGERLVVVNLGMDVLIDSAPEPLLAPPLGCTWKIDWSSEDPKYGGSGYLGIQEEGNWRLSGATAYIFCPQRDQTHG